MLLSIWLFSFVKQGFFPDLSYNQLYIEYKASEGVRVDKVKNDLIAYMEQLGRSDTLSVIGGVREEEKQSYYELNGGLLFLGMFLGALFLTGAAMIIYYKYKKRKDIYICRIN